MIKYSLINKGGILLIFLLFMALPCDAITRKDYISTQLRYHEMKMQRERIEKEGVKKKALSPEQAKKVEARKEFIKRILDNFKFNAEIGYEYNDNIYKSHTNEVSDNIMRVGFGARFIPKVSKKGKTSIYGEFKSEYLGYNTSDTDDGKNFLAKIGLNHRLSKKYAFLLEYQVAKLQTTSIDSTGTAANEFVDEWQYDYGVKFEADWKKFPWDIRYSHRDVKFDGGYDNSEYSRDVIYLSGYIPLKGKKEFLWDYTFGKVEYPNRTTNDDDFDFNRFKVGFKSKIFRKMEGSIKFGAGVYEYKDGTETNSFEYSGNLDYKPRKNFLLSLRGEKSTDASTISTEKSVDRNEVSLSCKYLPKFSKKLTLKGGLNFFNEEYSSGAKDDGISFSIGADYRMNNWLILGLDYTRSKRDSDEPEREYEQNILALKAKGEF